MPDTTRIYFIVLIGTSIYSNAWMGLPSVTRKKLPIPCRKGGIGSSSWNDYDSLNWEPDPNNVDMDFLRLELAINKTKAENNLLQLERWERLETMAAQKLPIRKIFNDNLMKPAVYLFLPLAILSMSSRKPLKIISAMSSFHFWTVVVLAPLLLWKVRTSCTRSPPTSSNDLDQYFDPQYVRFLSDYSDPQLSCQDHVLSLLEQWTSAVAGAIAFVGIKTVDTLSTSSLIFRILVRLGAIAALRQFPELWFCLHRSGQPRPLSFSTWALQSLVRGLLSPWVIMLDIVCLALVQGSVVTTGTLGSIFMASSMASISSMRHAPKILRKMLPVSLAPLLYSFMKNLSIGYQDMMTAGTNVLSFPSFTRVAQTLIWTFSVTPSLIHMRLFLRLLQSGDMNNIPLIEGRADLDQKTDKNVTWRCRLRWREPQRVHSAVSKAKKQFWYWLFFAGSVEDKLLREYRRDGLSDVKRRRLTVLQQVEREIKFDGDSNFVDRDEWKTRAMELLAERHQRDYDEGTFSDPLGVAVQQTFGIGLGFEFDHMSKPKVMDKESTRRLQARAAKAALKRAQYLYDPKRAKETLDAISDPKLRKKKAEEMTRRTAQEIQDLGTKLSQLIPTDAAPELNQNFTVQEYESNEFERTGTSSYVQKGAPRDQSPAISDLLRDYYASDDQPWDDRLDNGSIIV